jgi:uncharacterized integral membrane protein (TIGR00697 family)
MSKNNVPRYSPFFLVLASFFVAFFLISNIIAGKLALFFGITLPAAVILFPLTYILGDVLTEVYGFQRTRLVIWIGLGANLIMVFAFMITLALPYPEFWNGQRAYTTVLGLTPRLVGASLAAYLMGEFSNAAVLSRLKIKTKGRRLWMRTIGSTIVGEGIDTIVFIGVAFGGSMPWAVLGGMILAQYLWKVAYEVGVTPLTYLLVKWIKRREQIDVFDTSVNYNPFELRVEDGGI